MHVYPDTVLHSVVPLGSSVPLAGAPLSYVDAAETARRLAADGIRIAPSAVTGPPTTPIHVLA